MKLEFASTNTPQQIRENESAGRTLAAMVHCLLTDSGLPDFLWGELMQTTLNLSNMVPHAALGNITLYKPLYDKDANLEHFRAIGARAFVHVEIHTLVSSTLRPGKDVFASTVWTVSQSASTIPPKGM